MTVGQPVAAVPRKRMHHLPILLDTGAVAVARPPAPYDQQILPQLGPFLSMRNAPPARCWRRRRWRKTWQFEFRIFGRWPWRSKTTPARRALIRKERDEAKELAHWLQLAQTTRPKKRSECKGGPRPCHWLACKYHLFFDVSPSRGSIKCNFPLSPPPLPGQPPPNDLELQQVLHWVPETCALDVQDRGGVTLEEVGVILNVSMERARQIEQDALAKVRRALGDHHRPAPASAAGPANGRHHGGADDE